MNQRPNSPMAAEDVELFKAYSIQELQERRQLTLKDPVNSFIDTKIEQKDETPR